MKGEVEGSYGCRSWRQNSRESLLVRSRQRVSLGRGLGTKASHRAAEQAPREPNAEKVGKKDSLGQI